MRHGPFGETQVNRKAWATERGFNAEFAEKAEYAEKNNPRAQAGVPVPHALEYT